MMVEKATGSPIFTVDGVNYICVRKNGIFVLATSVFNVSPSFVIELLTQLTKVTHARLRLGLGSTHTAHQGNTPASG